MSLAEEFCDVPQLLLGVLMSCYPENRLKTIFQANGAMSWEIWRDFEEALETNPEDQVLNRCGSSQQLQAHLLNKAVP